VPFTNVPKPVRVEPSGMSDRLHKASTGLPRLFERTYIAFSHERVSLSALTGLFEGAKMARTIVIFCILLSATTPAIAQQSPPITDDEVFQQVQKQLAEAYNRKDVNAMAELFTENSLRVTPNGIFNGREAIRHNMQEAIEMGVHDYTVQRTVSRREGQFILNAGEWQAKVGDQPYRGFYSAILTTEGGQPKILEESVTVAAPGR
jgi:ketosteroid isomerase-like protein